jgi:hypothetical protein
MGEMRREVEIVQNAWKKTGYKWFVNEDGGEWVVGGIEEEFADGGLVVCVLVLLLWGGNC